ncbi:MAG: BTAD domain-containing putative transcriptional regulator [Anaerovoracaceae bacterium]
MKQENKLSIRMLGSFSLTWEGNTVREEDSRSRKMWLLLARLIYCRNRYISQEELFKLLWEDEPDLVNPYGALKTTLHRLRTQLSALGMPQEPVLRKDGTYAWNNDIPLDCDMDQFERFCKESQAAADPEEKLAFCLQALELYQGDFLPRLSMESWVVPVSAYFHNQYLETAETALILLEERGRFDEVVDICRRALLLEPYSESLYCHLMRGYVATDQSEAAAAAYEELSHLLLENFGVIPSEETRKIYREIMQKDTSQMVPIDAIRDQLREEHPEPGALFCEYDAFRVIYHIMARTIARTGDSVHIAILTVKGAAGKSLSNRSRDLAMKNLQNHLISSIRSGDVATKCSNTQFIVLLPRANYENSCMVCARIIRAFFRKHPHSPAEISYIVQALEPNAEPAPRGSVEGA